MLLWLVFWRSFCSKIILRKRKFKQW